MGWDFLARIHNRARLNVAKGNGCVMNSPSWWESSICRICRIKRLFVVLALSVLIIFLFPLKETSGPIVLTYSQTQLVGLTADPTGDMCSLLNTNTIIQAANEPISEESPQSALPPTHFVIDPFPTFNGIAVDALTNRVAMSDENRKSVLTYERTAGSNSSAVTEPMWQIIGPQTEAGYVAGVELDPKHREIYAVNNDIEDRIAVFDYDAQGDLTPKRRLYTPHQSWGISLNESRDELVISVQQLSSLVVYRREAYGMEAPIRVIQGPHTGMADPHGVRWDDVHHEIFAASHGNSTVITPYTASDSNATNQKSREARGDIGGSFLAPSINVFEEMASGDAIPIRTIQGSNTDLNWPMGIDIDKVHDEIAVANNGDNSILVFHRGSKGNVAPLRRIQGPKTGLASPVGLAIDSDHQELWVANYGDHTALVFALNASGNVAPKRIIRNAPAGTPTSGFGNPYAVAYDSKRDQIMVPNCVSQPRIAFFARSANGNSNPVRILAGQATHLSRTMHGIAYNARHDEIVVPVALADAILTFRGGATGSEAPIRVIQGPKTRMIRPHTVAVDEANNEIIVGDSGGRSVLVFDREANGDIPPKRIIQGLHTGMLLIVGVAVDPVHNRIVAASSSNVPGSQTGLFIFDRMANGDVTPLGIISGPHTGIVRPWQLAVDPQRGHIFVAAINNLSYPPYELNKPRPNLPHDVKLPSPWDSGSVGFIGVWNISDDGDISARAMIKGDNTYLVHPAGVAINPKAGEIYATDSVRNGLFTFLSPKLFPNQSGAR
jgi:DNA-binding beta-propeller fold protein YncE